MKLRMMRPSIEAISVAALVLAASAQVAFSAPAQRQSCSGIVMHDEDGYSLNADPNSKSLWCHASIGESENSPLAKRVLKICALGSHCHIEGTFEGHGVFYWITVSSVSLLKQ
jgi:hypothetical protein